MRKPEINPAWVNATYSVHFLNGLPIPSAVKGWSRKRRMRWMRRKWKGYAMPRIAQTVPDSVFDPIWWKREEVFRCPACEGDITSPHIANCNDAPGN